MNKKTGIALALLLAICTVLFLPACTSGREDVVFGTYCAVQIDGKRAVKTVKEIFSLLKNIDDTLSTSNTASEIAKLNAADAGEAISVSEYTAYLYALSETIQAYAPAFNPAIFPLVELWKFDPVQYPGAYMVPSVPGEDDIRAVLPLCSLSFFTCDDAAGTIVKTAAGAKLDFGAIAKGYAADLALNVAKDTKTIINIGGTIATNQTLSIAIESPFQQGNIAKFILDKECVSTSGSYERYYFGPDGTRYHHILAPDGYPSGYGEENPLAGVTVVGASAAMCDAFSTILMIEGVGAASMLTDRGYSAFLIYRDGKTETVGDTRFELL